MASGSHVDYQRAPLSRSDLTFDLSSLRWRMLSPPRGGLSAFYNVRSHGLSHDHPFYFLTRLVCGLCHLTFSSIIRLPMGEYSSSLANVGERACACRGARIPEEGAQRLTRLYWVLGAGLVFRLCVLSAPNARRARSGDMHYNSLLLFPIFILYAEWLYCLIFSNSLTFFISISLSSSSF